MTTDVPFHYPPELFNLLVDTIPLLNRSKKMLCYSSAALGFLITSSKISHNDLQMLPMK